MEYQQLILDLQVVETTLVQVDQMRLASQLNTSALNALSWITQSTATSIADFMLRTKKYQESLSAKGSGNKVKDLWNKVGWSMYPFAREFWELRSVASTKPIWVYGVSRDQGDASCSTPPKRV